jgi:hypothetical protein
MSNIAPHRRIAAKGQIATSRFFDAFAEAHVASSAPIALFDGVLCQWLIRLFSS